MSDTGILHFDCTPTIPPSQPPWPPNRAAVADCDARVDLGDHQMSMDGVGPEHGALQPRIAPQAVEETARCSRGPNARTTEMN